LPEYSLLEIKEHEKEILAKSGLSKEEFILLMKNLMKYLLIVKTAKIEKYRDRAYKIMGWIDEDDVMFIACALSYPKSMIWSDDKHFKIQKEIKVYNTQEIMKILSR
jgi:predicted nucleic acid-binding protein